MLKLAEKQIKMDRILTETDSIDEISCFFDHFTDLQRKVTRQRQVGFGRKPNRIFKFLGKHEGVNRLDSDSNSDKLVTFKICIKTVL